jgi:hypothetical protein
MRALETYLSESILDLNSEELVLATRMIALGQNLKTPAQFILFLETHIGKNIASFEANELAELLITFMLMRKRVRGKIFDKIKEQLEKIGVDTLTPINALHTLRILSYNGFQSFLGKQDILAMLEKESVVQTLSASDLFILADLSLHEYAERGPRVIYTHINNALNTLSQEDNGASMSVEEYLTILTLLADKDLTTAIRPDIISRYTSIAERKISSWLVSNPSLVAKFVLALDEAWDRGDYDTNTFLERFGKIMTALSIKPREFVSPNNLVIISSFLMKFGKYDGDLMKSEQIRPFR